MSTAVMIVVGSILMNDLFGKGNTEGGHIVNQFWLGSLPPCPVYL